MPRWTAFPYDAEAYRYDAAALKRAWPRLHACDCEPLPPDDRLLAGWALFHAGDFGQAYDIGLEAGRAGLTLANKAQSMHANYLETNETAKLAAFMQIAERARALQADDPGNAGAWYWMGYALGRYSQGISVAKALSQGLAGKIKGALETTIRLQPKHADAHVALGALHAEVIDTVGERAGKTHGADAATGLEMFVRALRLNPGCVIAMIEYAHALLVLQGERQAPQAERLYADAAARRPIDAPQRLEVERAKAELHA